MQVDRTEPRAESAGQLAADVRPQVVYAGVVGERDLNQTNLHNLPQPDPNTVQCAWGLASCARRVCSQAGRCRSEVPVLSPGRLTCKSDS